ncbi:MAG: hypothetical protein Q4C12_02505 [Clostridia bacterium]|nr:hypothetical protein [Clostridia bacterium]
MNWRSVKSIMIGLLVAVNVFLLANIFTLNFEHTRVDERVLQSAVQVLADKGIECSMDIIPKYYAAADILSVDFFTISELSQMFFENPVSYGSDGKNVVISENGTTLTIDGNSFSYTNGSQLRINFGEAELRKALAAKGFDMEDAVYDAMQDTFYRYHDRRKCEGLYIRAAFDERGDLCAVSGVWPNVEVLRENEDVEHIAQKIPQIEAAMGQGGKITGISLCYKLQQDASDVTLVPAWRIETEEKTIIL